MGKIKGADIELAKSIAENVMGWEENNGYWSDSGWKVAAVPTDLPISGFWRPEDTQDGYRCLKHFIDKVCRDWDATFTIKWSGLNGRFTFQAGTKKAEIRKCDFRLGNLAIAKAGYMFYMEMKRAQALRGDLPEPDAD